MILVRDWMSYLDVNNTRSRPYLPSIAIKEAVACALKGFESVFSLLPHYVDPDEEGTL